MRLTAAVAILGRKGEAKTLPTDVDPHAFIAAVDHPVCRADAEFLLELMQEATSREPVMRGPGIVGFGAYHYRYGTGREGDACAAGFSPRKATLSHYGLTHGPQAPALLERLGNTPES